MSDPAASFPGAHAQPTDWLRLADEYRQAAHVLANRGRESGHHLWSPFRLVAIHAIELYLSALLLHAGREPSHIRALQHDLAARADLAMASGLVLRKRTAAHLVTMSTSREYVVTRYGAELTSSLSQLNRLAATLDEVAEKVRNAIAARPSTAQRTSARS